MKADALIVRADPLFAANRDQIASLAFKHALGSMTEGGLLVSSGCLMSYAPNLAALGRGSAIRQNPQRSETGDLPLEQSTKFELAINLKRRRRSALPFRRRRRCARTR
jgi:hypothetical protein